MRTLFTAAAAVIALIAPSAAMAAPTITSAAVTGQSTLASGSSGRVWNTTVDSFYTLFIARPVSNIFNPNDNFSGAPVNNPDDGEVNFSINGDGFPTAVRSTVPSDPFYRLTLTLTEGSRTGTLSGVFSETTGIFTPTTPQLLFSSGNYALTEFSWFRSNNNVVGAFSTTSSPVIGPGSRADYVGAFTVAVSPVPEPATWALMILGFGAVGLTLRNRRVRQPIAAIA